MIATRLSSLPEVGGEAAIYVDDHDSDDLACIMVKLLENDELVRHRGSKGISRAAKFTWKSATRAMDGIIMTL